jgi:tetratricopeptide (TPR) repeat protein
MMTAAVPLLILVAALEPGGSASDAARTEDRPARLLFERAETKFNLGNFEAALADYQAAYEIEPLPGFLFNIGQCYRNLGDHERARFFYRRFLIVDPRTPNRRQTEKLIAEMSRRIDEPKDGAPAPIGAARSDQPTTMPAAFAPAIRQPEGKADNPPDEPRFYRRPWFWIGVGGALAAGVVAGFLLTRDDPRGTLPSIDAR